MTDIPFTSDRSTRWIFLSPHLDDAVYSCGGMISYLTQNGIDVEIWTVFSDQTRDLSSLSAYARGFHDQWQAGDYPYDFRQKEDARACKTVGAVMVHLGYMDCIYRKFPGTKEPTINSDAGLFGEIDPREYPLVDQISEDFRSRLVEPSIWVCPLGIGGHVDHRIVAAAASKVGKLLLHYADLPYNFANPVQTIPGMIQFSFDLPFQNLEVWNKAVMQYDSQFSVFWKNEAHMKSQYSEIINFYKGMPLWLSKPEKSSE
jgi:LmbE family N-acetylglucosaminyl deacetylase